MCVLLEMRVNGAPFARTYLCSLASTPDAGLGTKWAGSCSSQGSWGTTWRDRRSTLIAMAASAGPRQSRVAAGRARCPARRAALAVRIISVQPGAQPPRRRQRQPQHRGGRRPQGECRCSAARAGAGVGPRVPRTPPGAGGLGARATAGCQVRSARVKFGTWEGRRGWLLSEMRCRGTRPGTGLVYLG